MDSQRFLLNSSHCLTEFIFFIYSVVFRIFEYIQNILLTKSKKIQSSDTILIIGSCGAVGSQLSEKIANYGCRLILIDKDEKLSQNVEIYKNVYKCEVFHLVEDISNHKSVLEYLKSLIGLNIVPNIIIFNAAINHQCFNKDIVGLEDCKIYEKIMQVNFLSCVNIFQYLMPIVSDIEAKVAVTCSVASFLSISGESVYSASKAALNSYIQCLEVEYPKIFFAISYPSKISGKMFEHFQFRNIPSYIISDVSPSDVADGIIGAIINKRVSIYNPWHFKYSLFFPSRFLNFILIKFYKSYKRN